MREREEVPEEEGEEDDRVREGEEERAERRQTSGSVAHNVGP